MTPGTKRLPDPYDTLTVFAEVSIALAGFSGIAIAIGRRTHGELSPLESRRLFNLFGFTALTLFTSLLGMTLLHVERIDGEILWRGGSVLMVLTGVPWLLFDWHKIRALSPDERAHVHPFVIYPFTVIAVLALALQLVNAVFLGIDWIFFLALVVQLAFAFQQFILLVESGMRAA
jgi:hypothetical protein